MSSLIGLPRPALEEILRHLSPKNLLSVGATCRAMNAFVVSTDFEADMRVTLTVRNFHESAEAVAFLNRVARHLVTLTVVVELQSTGFRPVLWGLRILPRLTKVMLRNFYAADSACHRFVWALMPVAPALQHLHLQKQESGRMICSDVALSDDLARGVADCWGQQLRSFDGFWVENAPEGVLRRFPRLERFGATCDGHMDMNAVSACLVEMVGRLKSVSLCAMSKWNHRVLEAIASCAGLESVFVTFAGPEIDGCVHGHGFPDYGLRGLRSLTHLHLRIRVSGDAEENLNIMFQQSSFRLEYISLENTTLSAVAAQALCNRHGLVEAAFAYVNVTDTAMSAVTMSPSLKALLVSRCNGVSFTFLEGIANTSPLQLVVASRGVDCDLVLARINSFRASRPRIFLPDCVLGNRSRACYFLKVCVDCKQRIRAMSECCVASCLASASWRI